MTRTYSARVSEAYIEVVKACSHGTGLDDPLDKLIDAVQLETVGEGFLFGVAVEDWHTVLRQMQKNGMSVKDWIAAATAEV